MNFLSEILAFTEWKEVNPLPASAIALWYELMAICNKTGWQQEFTVPNGLLQVKAGLSRKEFDRARHLLIQAGRITYKKSNRVNQAGRYEIISFVQKGQREGQQEGQQKGQREGQRLEHNGGNERGTLFKHKHKQNESNKNIFVDGSVEMNLAIDLKRLILANNSGAKIPNDLQSWAKIFDLMIRIDNRSADLITQVMQFSQLNDFWKSNILSPKKLREKFDTLYLQSQNQRGSQVYGAGTARGPEKPPDDKKRAMVRSLYFRK